MDTIGRRDLLKGLAITALCGPYIVRNSSVLMPIADRSLITYEVRGEKLAEGGGPLPANEWLQTMQFRVPRKRVNFETPYKLLAAAKQARADVIWSGVIIR